MEGDMKQDIAQVQENIINTLSEYENKQERHTLHTWD